MFAMHFSKEELLFSVICGPHACCHKYPFNNKDFQDANDYADYEVMISKRHCQGVVLGHIEITEFEKMIDAFENGRDHEFEEQRTDDAPTRFYNRLE